MKQTRSMRIRYNNFCTDSADSTMVKFLEDDIKSTVGDFFFSSVFYGRMLLFGVVGSCWNISCNSACNSVSLLEAAVVTARFNKVLA